MERYKMILLSVLIPFYNNSKYIRRYINRLKEVDERVEIIFIDDGSSEEEYQLLEKSVRKISNKNIVLLRNEKNKGAGYSKNKILSLSKGKYVIFLDSDDGIDKKYYLKILNIIEKYNPDIICTDIAVKYKDYVIKSSILIDNLLDVRYKKISKNLYKINSNVILGNKFASSACNKAIKKELFQNYRFKENKCDDLTAIIPVVCQANDIIYVDNLYYYYYQTERSLTRNNSLKMHIDSVDSLIETVEILKKNKVELDKIKLFYANNFIPFLYYNVINNKEKIRKKIFKYIEKLTDTNNFNVLLVLENKYIYNYPFMTDYVKKIFNYIIEKKYNKVNNLILINKIKYRFYQILKRI